MNPVTWKTKSKIDELITVLGKPMVTPSSDKEKMNSAETKTNYATGPQNRRKYNRSERKPSLQRLECQNCNSTQHLFIPPMPGKILSSMWKQRTRWMGENMPEM